ncbi:hypothetical protein [Streptomyces sp. NPDC060194]|uniref:hypothetical protein n=1 Tax=Streptomyces sp. NPDC060194 TaxID=3347069 RepID=UPI003651899B
MLTRAALVIAVGAGVAWWWAVARLLLDPADAGALEGTVVVGGWGLSLLPVHCVGKARAKGVAPWTLAWWSGRRKGS